MHEIYKLTPLHKNPAQLDVQIECIAAYDECLLLGTRQGFLLMYNISKSTDPTDDSPDIELRRYNKTFSKKAIQQLDVIPEAQLLICLTDNVVQVHNLAAINFPLIHTIAGSKGATLFTYHAIKEESLTGTTSVTVRLCVVVKRKLQLYYWKKNEFHTLTPDISLNDMPKTISWCMESVCVGYRNEYILYKLNGDQIPLFPTSSTRPNDPCITRAGFNTFALGKDKQTILVNNLGTVESAHALRWSDVPAALAWDEPYALAIIGDSIEIQTTEPGASILQTLKELRKVRFLVQCGQGVLYAASISQVWCLHAVDVTLQRNILLGNKQFELALSLTDISKESEDEKQKMRIQIQTELAYNLFSNKKFKESMQQFLKLGTNAYDVIRLFPELLPSQQQQSGTTGSNEQLDVATESLTGRDLEEGLMALIDYLTEVRLKLLGETQSNVNASGNLNERPAATKQTQQLLQIIDTTLLKCFLQTNDAMIAPLLRRNHCHMAEAERTLKKHGKHNELIILYQTKGQHRCALDWLRTENRVDRTITYLQHLGSEEIGLIFEFAEWVLRAAPEEALRIFTEDLVEVEGLPRPRVLDYLLRSHPKQVVPYLQHVLGVWDDNNPLFHNALVHQYREKAAATDDPGAEIAKNKLLEFLDESKYYTPETVLMHFPTDCFFEERANILGRMKKFADALVIFVRVIGDLTKATNYCNKIWENSNNENEVYIILIKLLLDPSCITVSLPGITLSPKTAQPDLESALTLIEEYAERLDPLRVIAILPKDVAMSRLTKFLQVSLHNAVWRRRQVQLLKGLLKSEHLRCLDEKLQLQGQHVLITDMNVCSVCKKRFGNQSALVRYPNGDVVHFSCHEKKN